MNDLTLVRLLEPPIVAVSAREGLAIFQHDDGSVSVAIGSSRFPAETINIPAHMIGCIGRTLMGISDGT